MDALPQTQHQLNEHERDCPSASPEFDAVMARRRRTVDFDRSLSGFVAGGATVCPDLTHEQASTYGAVFAARMSIVVEVWRRDDEGRCSQALSNSIIGCLQAMQEAAAEPIRLGPDTVAPCAPVDD
jgi:hypothetical protein